MSGDFMYSAEVEMEDIPVKPAASVKIEKGLKRLLILAGIILGGECIWLFGVSPCIPLSTVEVKGFPGFEKTEALAFAGIGEGASFVSVNAGEAEKILLGHYLVESAKVLKRFPDRLSIFLEPRRAIGLSLVDIQGRLLPVYFDKHGVIFRIGNGKGDAPPYLPVISGILIEQPVLGMHLPAALTPLFAELGKIADESPELLGAISEIQIVRKPFDGFDLVLYPIHNPIRVRMGSSINQETLRYVLLMLDVFKSGNSASLPEEIDFRSGMGAYKVKEAPSGE
ncbi:MAG: FtsQ-type POTRA domain-containing protein [Treponema sp.]|jgi:cell division protein FtsQ|nr:FtsQ-type POTRA domain-containing protein [Treponema sp.]